VGKKSRLAGLSLGLIMHFLCRRSSTQIPLRAARKESPLYGAMDTASGSPDVQGRRMTMDIDESDSEMNVAGVLSATSHGYGAGLATVGPRKRTPGVHILKQCLFMLDFFFFTLSTSHMAFVAS
jgi:hypothetical protein